MRFLIGIILYSFCAVVIALPKNDLPGEGGGGTGTVVDNSTLSNTASGSNTALNNSNINTGIEAKNAVIKDSTVSSATNGTINASASQINTGVKASGTEITGSTLSSNANVNIDASGSRVTAGAIELGGANGANINTNVNASVKAENSTVNIGTITGNANGVSASTNVGAAVSVKNKTVNMGTITLNERGGGPPAGGGYKARNDKEIGPAKGSTALGNVVVESNNVKEVNTTVGNSGSIGEKVKTRNMSKTYADNDGVDPSGTKNVYVSKKEREAAEKKGKAGQDGGAGNTYIGNSEKDREIRKVNTYVE